MNIERRVTEINKYTNKFYEDLSWKYERERERERERGSLFMRIGLGDRMCNAICTTNFATPY